MKNDPTLVPMPFDGRTPVSTQGIPAGYSGAGFDPYHPSFEEQEEQAFDPVKFFWFIVHYRVLIAFFMLAAIVLGVLFNFLQTPIYKSTTKLEIATSGARVFQDLEIVTQNNDLRAFETAKQKMQSRELAKRVVFELNLTENPVFLAPRPRFSLTNLVRRVTGSTNTIRLEDLTAEERQELAIDIISDNLSVSIIRNTSILAIGFQHADPGTAATIANQVTKSFIDQSIDKKSETSDVARQFIEQQSFQAKKKLQESEKKLVEYAEQAGITVTGSEVSLISSSISEINSALSQAIQDRLTAERFNEQVKAGNAAALPDVFESESIQTTKLKIAELRATYQEKLSTLKPGFPEMQRLRAQINELNKQVNSEVSAIARSVEIKYEQAKVREAALQQELIDLEKQQTEYQRKNIQYTILKREVDSNRSQYESLIGKLNEVGIGAELKDGNASIVEQAIPSNGPFSPRLLLNLLGSIGMFAGIAAISIYVLELLNNTFTIPDQLEGELNIPVLGIIPFIKESEFQEAQENATSQFAEAYRTLRTSVQFTGTDVNIKSLMVTSSEPSEGKSLTAYRLAHDFASLGRSVLVIDADLRKPRMHRLFNTDAGMGLSNLLTNVATSNDVLKIFRETDNPNITFLSAGTIPPNPTDLLVSQKMGLTIHYCVKKYDLVIIDCAPVMGLADAPIIARQVDATLMVVSAKQVTRKAAKNAVKRLRAVGANIIGAAFTKFQVNQLDYNYAYRYMQYNYYSYEADNPQPVLLENKSGEVGQNNAESSKKPFMFAFFNRIARYIS